MIKEPYRLFFPTGIFFLLWGALVWLPQLWNAGDYPVLAHRFLMLNGFTASFIAGFLMTAIPKFSKTMTARKIEVYSFFAVTCFGIVLAYTEQERWVSLISSLQASIILFFLFSRIFDRKENPPYSFIFIFVGLILWLISSGLGVFFDIDTFKRLHYEGAIASIILGVGSRLIPGILGHIEIVKAQRERYEKQISIIATVPPLFFILILSFVGSYFAPTGWGSIVRALVVTVISFKYWLLWKTPKTKTALTWSVWTAGWLILLSFILKASWEEGIIHASHSFFISGIVLLSLLIGTRVLVSHGPSDNTLENSPILYLVGLLLVCASVTRVTAFLLPEQYLVHLGYSAMVFVLAVLIWSVKYLKYVAIK